jgi:hypothetical protein
MCLSFSFSFYLSPSTPSLSVFLSRFNPISFSAAIYPSVCLPLSLSLNMLLSRSHRLDLTHIVSLSISSFLSLSLSLFHYLCASISNQDGGITQLVGLLSVFTTFLFLSLIQATRHSNTIYETPWCSCSPSIPMGHLSLIEFFLVSIF